MTKRPNKTKETNFIINLKVKFYENEKFILRSTGNPHTRQLRK